MDLTSNDIDFDLLAEDLALFSGDEFVEQALQRGVDLKKYSEKWDRKIIFTEYGFKSSDYNVSGMQDDKTKVANMNNQFNGYRAFFETIWKEDFFAGGFLWKWTFFPNEQNSGMKNARYTPQGKPAYGLIRDVYGAR